MLRDAPPAPDMAIPPGMGIAAICPPVEKFRSGTGSMPGPTPIMCEPSEACGIIEVWTDGMPPIDMPPPRTLVMPGGLPNWSMKAAVCCCCCCCCCWGFHVPPP